MGNRQANKAHQLIAGMLVVLGFLIGALSMFLTRDQSPDNPNLTAARYLMGVAIAVFIVGAVWWVIARLVAWWQD